MSQENSFCHRYGPWSVVTSASSGIGRAIATVLAKKSLNLVLVARNRAALAQIALDVASRFSVKTLIIDAGLSQLAGTQVVLSAIEQLDVGLLVASAGFGTSGPFLDASLHQETAMLDVNCRALMMQTHEFPNRFAKRGRGGITDWVESVADSKSAEAYRKKVNDTESASMWQSLAFGPNYKRTKFRHSPA